jgi:crotonobetainyl-CoA:carnitine CoA-transferase CaiB-like acyl-CoA transferase
MKTRGRNKAEIVRIVEAWLASMPSDDASLATLRAKRVAVAPILSVEEAMNHPHLRERGTVRAIHDPILGEFQIPGFPLRFSGFPDELEFDAPTLGQHNAAILDKHLGYSAERIAALADDGVLHSARY